MNVFKEMGCSIGKPAVYPYFLKNKKGKIFGYGMLLLTCYFLLSAFIPLLSLQIKSGGIGHVVNDFLPDFELSREGFWIEEQVFLDEGDTYVDLDPNYYFDEESAYDFARSYSTVIMMDPEKIIIKSNGQMETLYCSDLGDDVFSKKSVLAMVPMIYIIIIVGLLFYYIWIAALFFFGVLLVALAGMILSSVLKAKLTFGQIYIFALYGRTLPLLVKGLLKLAGLSIPFFWVINFGVTLVYMYFAMKKLVEMRELELQDYRYRQGNEMQGYAAQDYAQSPQGWQDPDQDRHE